MVLFMKIIVDAMGGDNAPEAIVKGAIMACKEFDVEIILVGIEEQILKFAEGKLPEKCSIVHAPDTISMDDNSLDVLTAKAESSMMIAFKMMAKGEGDALVSAGSTGAFLTGATLIVKRIRGVRRAALAPIMPSESGGVVLIDCGATAVCTPEYLEQFGFMGSVYAKQVFGKESPRVALLNNGAEEHKGTELYQETHQRLKKLGQAGQINFVGNAESREVLQGVCEVIVADGFVGNIFLKAVEGTGLYFSKQLKTMFTKSLKTKIAALLAKKGIAEFKEKIDYKEVGGAPLLGISKPVFKAHGSSTAYSFRSAIKQAIQFTNAGIVEEITKELKAAKEKE